MGSRRDNDGREGPRAVSEYLIERMLLAGVDRFCIIISPGKSDILEYYGGKIAGADVCYVVQSRPSGLCDALFCARPLLHDSDSIVVGLPDTIWFPADGLASLPERVLSFLLFPVCHPELFDAVLTGEDGSVESIQVKQAGAGTNWIWGAFKLPGDVFFALERIWHQRGRGDEYFGTLVNAYLQQGGRATAVRAGEVYVDVGTVHGYREALQALEWARESDENKNEHPLSAGQFRPAANAGSDPASGTRTRPVVP